MADILEEFPHHLEEMRGRRSKFKEEWFDGQIRLLYMDTDLCEYANASSARNSLISKAKRKGLDWRLVQHKGNLYFQVVKESVTP